MRLFCLLIALTLTGCATVRESYAPDGRKAYTLNCSGAARGWDKCLAAAGDICGAAGYDVLDRNREMMSAAGVSANSSGAGGFGVTTSERSMLIACKK
jgi:hypothetical protein